MGLPYLPASSSAAEVSRFRLELEFNGAGYVGWQRQDNGPSIQAALEKAVAGMLGEQTTAVAAGRTDAGVHALALTIHIDLEREIAPPKLMAGLNHHLLDEDISVVRSAVVSGEFHARFSAQNRSYLYRILNRRAPPSLDSGRVWHVGRRLDHEAMANAAKILIGHHDFSSFRAGECQAKSPLKTLDELRVERDGEEVHLHLKARSFLHHQVRNITGSLQLIGCGTRDADWLKEVLEARDRRRAGPTAPAHGLYFVSAEYQP